MSASEKKNLQLVQVYTRQRPFTQNEIELRRPSVVHSTSFQEICLKSGSVEKKYNFDRVFGFNSTQSEVYNVVVLPMIEFVLSGYTCTVFAYGQTGTGKTYTMIGQVVAPNLDFFNDPSVGMVSRAAIHLFSELNQLNKPYVVSVSFVEIYNEEVRDLLVSDSVALRVYEDPDNKGATCIRGVTEVTVTNAVEVYDMLNLGVAERQTAATNLNRHSSRSHTIFTIIVHTREINSEGEEITKTGKLHLIDLAGSENIGRSGATEMRAREAGTINKSLLTLGKVIKALATKQPHVPYRESKLTRILQDSLGGKSKTSLIATFSPCVECFDETVSTLDYAHMARSVANCPTANINKKQTNILQESQSKLAELRLELNAARTGEGFYMNNGTYEKMIRDNKVKSDRILHLLQEILHLEEHISSVQQHNDELNKSFERANQNLHSIEEELETKSSKQKQHEQAIEQIEEEITKLNEVTNLYSTVCETSAEHGDIYHRKYDRQCDSTVHNATVAANMFSTSMDCLSALKDKTNNFVEDQDIQLNDGINRAKLIEENQSVNKEQLNELLSQIQSMSATSDLTIDNLLRNKIYSESKFLSQVDSFFTESNQLQLRSLDETMDNVKVVRDAVHKKEKDIGEHTAKYSVMMDKAFQENHDLSTLTNEQLQNLYDRLQNRQGHIQNQLTHVRKIKEIHRNYLEVYEAKREEARKELECIESMRSILDNIDATTKSRPKPLLKLKESLEEYNECLDSMEDLVALVQNVTDSINKNNEACQTEVKSCGNKTNEYISEFMKVFEDDMNHYNEEIKDMLSNWADQIIVIKDSLHNTTEEQCKHIDDRIDKVLSAGEEYDKDVKHLVEEATQKVKNLEKDLISKVHEGDTPVKPVYNLP